MMYSRSAGVERGFCPGPLSAISTCSDSFAIPVSLSDDCLTVDLSEDLFAQDSYEQHDDEQPRQGCEEEIDPVVHRISRSGSRTLVCATNTRKALLTVVDV